MAAGSPAADLAIQRALGRDGASPPYTADEAALRRRLPVGYDVQIITAMAGSHYAACWRLAEPDYAHTANGGTRRCWPCAARWSGCRRPC